MVRVLDKLYYLCSKTSLEKKALKILIIRFSSIGDIVLTTPVVRCLKLQLQAEVHYLTKKSYKNILLPNPYIDKVISIEKKVQEVITKLKAEKYDYIIDLHKNIRSAQVRFALTAKSSSFDKLNIAKWLMVNFKINRLPDIHIVDRYLAAAKPLGIQNDEAGLDYYIPKDQEIDLNQFFQKKYERPKTPYIAFVIGATYPTKRLTQEKIITICRGIRQTILLIGGPEEATVGEDIATKAGKHVLNTCGQLSLHQSASLVRQAEKVITHDTGLMHIAAAFQKKIITIWGNTIPAFGMYPYFKKGVQTNSNIEVVDLDCRPCSKIGFEQCPKGHFRCMKDIEAEKIIKLVNS